MNTIKNLGRYTLGVVLVTFTVTALPFIYVLLRLRRDEK